MTVYHGGVPALLPGTNDLIIGGEGQVYATDDTERATPLPVVDVGGNAMGTIRSGGIGVIDRFGVPDGHDEVVWVTGGYEFLLQSYDGLKSRVVAAENKATEAANSAAASAESAGQNRVPIGGAAGQVLAKLTNVDNDLVWINPPTGGGSGSGTVVIGADDPIPPGTPAMTPVFRLEGTIPTPEEVSMLTGPGDLTSAYGSLATSVTLAAPSATAVGDLLVAVGWAQAAVAPFDWTVPAGWTSAFEATAGRRLLVAWFPVPDAAAVTAVTAGSHNFQIAGDGQSSRNGVMIFRVTGANLTAPFVGMSAYAEGTGTQKTFPEFAATAPAAAQLLVSTAQLSSGAAEPVITHAAGYQAVNSVAALNTAVPPAKSVGSAVLYRISGTTVPERIDTFTPSYSAGVAGLHLAIAGA